MVDLAKREIKLNRQKEAFRAARGAWKAEDHPELADALQNGFTIFVKNP